MKLWDENERQLAMSRRLDQLGEILMSSQLDEEENFEPSIRATSIRACKSVLTSPIRRRASVRKSGAYVQEKNDSFHQLIWKYVPKFEQSGERAVFDFNTGKATEKGLLEAVGSCTGKFFGRDTRSMRCRDSDPRRGSVIQAHEELSEVD